MSVIYLAKHSECLSRFLGKEHQFESAGALLDFLLPRGILLYGPPGTGKTLLMKSVAEELLVKNEGSSEPTKCYVEISGPQIISEYYGVSEKNLRRIFRKAEDLTDECGIVAVLIDELDAIAPSREMVRGELEQRLVSQLLTLMDGLRKRGKGRVIVMATTNQIWRVDEALRRPGRFDKEFEIWLPDQESRKEILKIHLGLQDGRLCTLYEECRQKKNLEDVLDRAARESEGFSGADLMSVARSLILDYVKSSLSKNNPGKISLSSELIKRIRETIPSIARGLRVERLGNLCGSKAGLRGLDDVVKELSDALHNAWTGRSVPVILLECGNTLSTRHSKHVVRNALCRAVDSLRRVREVSKDSFRIIEVWASSLLSKYVGETEENVRRVISRFAELGNAALVIYGIEALAGKHNEVLSGAVSELINGITDIIERADNTEQASVKAIIATCIRRESLTPEILTLFDKVITGKR